MLFYNLPTFADKDVYAFLSGLARANNLIKKACIHLSPAILRFTEYHKL